MTGKVYGSPNLIKMPQEIDSIFDLSFAEKLQLVEDLWDDIGGEPSSVPLHEWQREELEARKLRWRTSLADTGASWEALKKLRDHRAV